jgi:hypothetical protein
MKKRILGIAALVAVLAMGLTFTACPPPEDNAVIFNNYTTVDITVTIKGGEVFTLKRLTSLFADPDTKTVKKAGDIVLQGISTSSAVVNADIGKYIDIDGNATGGKQKYKDGVNLGSGILNFRPNQSEVSDANGFSIKVIPQDE